MYALKGCDEGGMVGVGDGDDGDAEGGEGGVGGAG